MIGRVIASTRPSVVERNTKVQCIPRDREVAIEECRSCEWLIDVDLERERPVRCRPADPYGRLIL